MGAGIRERACVRGVSRLYAYLRLRMGAAVREACRAFLGCPQSVFVGPPPWTWRRLLPPLATLTAFTAFVIATTPLAYARIAHSYESVITEVPGEGSGGKSVSMPGPLQEANSMTVFSGDLYVAERVGSEARTDQFTPSLAHAGEFDFVSQLPLQPEPNQQRSAGLAFGSAAGEAQMYLGQSLLPPSGTVTGVNVFATETCGTLECSTLKSFWTGVGAPTPFGDVAGVAVDHSEAPGDWAKGDAFVTDDISAENGGDAVVDVIEPQGAGGEKYVTQVTGPSASKPFHSPCCSEGVSVAVSAFNGDLIVGDENAVYVFRPEEEGSKTKKGRYVLVRELDLPGAGPLTHVRALAVDDANGEIYASTADAVDEFGPEGVFRGDITGVPREGVQGGVKGQTEEVPLGPTSLAVDPASHRVFVGQHGVVDVFGPDLVEPDVVTEAPSNLALESDPETGTTAWRIEPTGSVNPLEAGVASCGFAWVLTEAFGHEAPCAAPVPNGPSPVQVHATLMGLEPDTAYVYRLQAKNEHGTNKGEPSEDYRFTTPGPGLRSESVSDVSFSGASFEATIAPHDAPVEEHDLQAPAKSPTSYLFQYSTQPTTVCAHEPAACVSAPAAPVGVGSATTDVQVSQHASGLAANTTYHYRLVAINEALPASKPGVLVPFYGPDRTFTTQGPGGPVVLPDGRAWELVSPADKKGARILPSGQASVDGSTFAFLANNPTEPEPKGAGAHGLQVLSSRVAPGQWSSVDINLSRSAPEGTVANNFHEYRYFSEDFGLSVVESEGPFSIPEGPHLNTHGEWEQIIEASPVPTERTPYLRHNTTCASAPATCFQPLLDSQDVTSGEKYEGPMETVGAANAVAATPDVSHVIIDSSVPLTTGGPAVTPTSRGLYEWSAAKAPAERLSLVNVLEDGELGPAATSAVSRDGSRVFFTSCRVSGGSIRCGSYYVRDVLRGETTRLDLTEGSVPPNNGEGTFEGASADGARAFFTDTGRLTKDAGVKGADLYVCELGPEAAGPPKCALTDLTPLPAPGQPGANEDAQVSHALGVSQDGSYVYFLAKGVQAAGATPGEGERENLYVAHEHEGKWTTRFITSPVGIGLTHVVSPDGRSLAFSAENSLTGYDNRDAKTGLPDSEVYLYDAEAAKLVCASCNPSGSRPIGPAVVPASAHETPLGDLGNESLTGAGGSRSVFDGGRLFFDTKDALVPQDTNGNLDVYEFEPAVVGSCTTADPAFNAARGGCVGLISSGRAAGESVFLEASANASDVFFSTSERLVAKDTDTSVDVYDAHECSSASPCVSAASAPEECASAAACRPAPVPQPSIFGAPSSATFTGPGNLTPVPPAKPRSAAQIRAKKLSRALASCRHRYKRQRKRRAACEKQAHKAYGAAKKTKRARKSAHVNRRAGR
jgi:hypothetical protein